MNVPELLDAMRRSLEQRFADLSRSPAAGTLSALTLGLELRLKLEEQLLLPALYESGALDRAGFTGMDEQIDQVRQLSADLREPVGPEPKGERRLRLLQQAVERHFDDVDALLARSRHGPALQGRRLADDMQAMMRRWQLEIASTGDIEDEERDPVGLPPR